jgi:sigma-B regulation protein RsbU (phosphoserine phosphatase)
MKLLIAEDKASTLASLTNLASYWGYDVVGTSDGAQAWNILQAEDAPKLALLDWMIPFVDGLEVCRLTRQKFPERPPYLILITGRGSEDDLVAGLAGGADEYLRKPVSPTELRARLDAGKRIVELQNSLTDRVRKLEEALTRVKQLQGLLPICSYCKKVRDDGNYWRQVEEYISANSEAQFSHGICPDCFETIVEPELRQLAAEEASSPRPGKQPKQLVEIGCACPYRADDAASSPAAPSAPNLPSSERSWPEPELAASAVAEQRNQDDCRTSFRFDCNWEIPFRLRQEKGMAMVRNVSAGGLRLELGRMVEPGDVLAVELYNRDRNFCYVKDTRIVHAAPVDQGRCVAGSAFIQQLSQAEIRQLLASDGIARPSVARN